MRPVQSMKNYRITKFRVFSFLLIAIVFLGIFFYLLGSEDGPSISPYPDGKNFAFTITADPDGDRLEKDKLIYDFLTKAGLRTTIAVWVKEPTRSSGIPDTPGIAKKRL